MRNTATRRFGVGGILLIALVSALSFNSRADAAIESRDILRTYFETGDVPTQEQFADLIDSYIHKTDDGLTLTGIGAELSIKYPGGYDAIRVGARTGINETLPYTTLNLSSVIMATNWVDQEGFLPLVYQDTVGQPHYGYLYIVGGSPPDGFAPTDLPVFPMFVQDWAWESEANTSIVTAPEPTTAAVLFACSAMTMLRRRRAR